MAKVLFTWELGQNSGHVLPALPILQQLKAQGHEVVLALRDVRTLPALLVPYGFKVLQAPAHPDVMLDPTGPQPQTMADILVVFGFGSPTVLGGLVHAWNQLMDLVQPDVLIASYAPLSLLVARSRGLRTNLLALPFELPPKQHPLPPFRPGTAPPEAPQDEKIVATVNEVFSEAPIPLGIGQVHEIFAADWTGVMAFREFDYHVRENVEYLGAMYPPELPSTTEPEWSVHPTGKDRPRVFVHLHPMLPQFEAIRRELPMIDASFFVVIADAPMEVVNSWHGGNIRATSRRVGLAQILRQTDAVLCYGGLSTVLASAMAGKPMIFVPRDLEQILTSLRAAAQGLGAFPDWRQPWPIRRALQAVFFEPRLIRARKQFVKKNRGFDFHGAVRHACGCVLS